MNYYLRRANYEIIEYSIKEYKKVEIKNYNFFFFNTLLTFYIYS